MICRRQFEEEGMTAGFSWEYVLCRSKTVAVDYGMFS